MRGFLSSHLAFLLYLVIKATAAETAENLHLKWIFKHDISDVEQVLDKLQLSTGRSEGMFWAKCCLEPPGVKEPKNRKKKL